MPDNQSKRQQGIESLLAERKKFEAWLTQLAARRESTAEHVFARVHADYAKRLDDVRGRLGAEADGIRALVTDLEERLATEQRLVTEKSDERAELELRATVGEFSEKEWNSTRAKLDSAISEIRATFETTERDLVELREILRSVVAPPLAGPAAESPVEPETVAAAEPTAPPAHRAPAGPARESVVVPVAQKSTPAKPRARTPFDELAFLKSVAGTPTTPTPMAAIPALPVELEAEPESVEPPPEAESPSEPMAGFAQPSALDADYRPDTAPDPASESSFDMTPEPAFESDPAPEEEPVRGRASSRTLMADDSPLGAPTPRTSQAIRSLKCQECGTLNFPTEWYCERCGGELAAF